MEVINQSRSFAHRRNGHRHRRLFKRKLNIPKHYLDTGNDSDHLKGSQDAKRYGEELRNAISRADTAVLPGFTHQLFATELRRPLVRSEESLLSERSTYEQQKAVKCYHFMVGYSQGQPPVLGYPEAKLCMHQIKFERKNAADASTGANTTTLSSMSVRTVSSADSGIASTVSTQGLPDSRDDSSRNFTAVVDSQCEARRSAMSRLSSFTDNVLWKLRPLELALMLANNGLFLLSHRDQFAIKLTLRSRLEQLARVPDDYEQQPGPKQLKVRCAFCKRVFEVPFTTSFALAYGADEPSNPSYERMKSELAKEKQTAAQWYIDIASNWAALYAVASNVRLQHERRSPSCPMVVGVKADNVEAEEGERLKINELVEQDQFYKRAQANCMTQCQRFYRLKGNTEADSNTKAAAYWTAAHGDHETTLSESSVTRAAEDAYLWTSYKFLPTGAYNDGLLLCSDDVSQLGSYIEYEMSGKRRLGDPTKVYDPYLTPLDGEKPVTLTLYDNFPEDIYEEELPSTRKDDAEADNFGQETKMGRYVKHTINRSDEEAINGYEPLFEHFVKEKPCFPPFICLEMRLETFETGVQVDSKRISLHDYLVLYELEAPTARRLYSGSTSSTQDSRQHTPEQRDSEDDGSQRRSSVETPNLSAVQNFGRQQAEESMSTASSEQDDYNDSYAEGDRLSLDELRRRMGNTDWSADRRGLFERLADAGFLSLRRSEAELRDVCVCFWCGLAIGGWYEEADAFIEHARHQSTEDACAYLFFQRGRQFIIDARLKYGGDGARTRRIDLRNVEEVVDASVSRVLYALGFYERSPGSASGSAVASSSRSAANESATLVAARASAMSDNSASTVVNKVSASTSNSSAADGGNEQQQATPTAAIVPHASSASTSSSSQSGQIRQSEETRYDPVVSFRTGVEFRIEEREIRARKDLRCVRNLVFLCGVQPPIVAFAMERWLKATSNDFVNTRQFLEALWDVEARMRTSRLTDFNLFQRRFNESRSAEQRNVISAYVQPALETSNTFSPSSSQNLEDVQSQQSNEHLATNSEFSFSSANVLPNSLSSSIPTTSAYAHSSAEQTDVSRSHGKCFMCRRNTAQVVVNPCGHFVFCSECAKRKPKRCPQCNENIVSVFRIYT